MLDTLFILHFTQIYSSREAQQPLVHEEYIIQKSQAQQPLAIKKSVKTNQWNFTLRATKNFSAYNFFRSFIYGFSNIFSFINIEWKYVRKSINKTPERIYEKLSGVYWASRRVPKLKFYWGRTTHFYFSYYVCSRRTSRNSDIYILYIIHNGLSFGDDVCHFIITTWVYFCVWKMW